MAFVPEKFLTVKDIERGVSVRLAGTPSYGISTSKGDETYARFENNQKSISFYFYYLQLGAHLSDSSGNTLTHRRVFLFPNLTFCAFVASEIEKGKNQGRYDSYPGISAKRRLLPDSAIYIYSSNQFLLFVKELIVSGKLIPERQEFRSIISDVREAFSLMPIINMPGYKGVYDIVDSEWLGQRRHFNAIKDDFRKYFEQDRHKWPNVEIDHRF